MAAHTVLAIILSYHLLVVVVVVVVVVVPTLLAGAFLGFTPPRMRSAESDGPHPPTCPLAPSNGPTPGPQLKGVPMPTG